MKIVIAVLVLLLLGGAWWWIDRSEKAKQGKLIELEKQQKEKEAAANKPGAPANSGNVSPISGLPCANWNRRPIAVMQPSDVPARPAAGFADADMVIEMPVITATITRLMGVYVCNDPDDVGSMRSARHDFVHLAKGLDAIFVHWGRSDMEWFKEKLNAGVIDNINCNDDAGKPGLSKGFCYRKEASGTMRGVDTGYAKFAKLIEGAKEYGYRLENQFVGYPHQEEAKLEDRGPDKWQLRVGFPGPFAVDYFYDRASNSYFRLWNDIQDTDRNNEKKITPKNVVILIAESEQIEGQYNNVQLGDPWMDRTDSGVAFFYMDGKEIKGSWKKDKSKVDSKLMFLKEDGSEVKFIPGQIWVDVIEPGYGLKWKAPGA